ncbi:MAG: heparinase II/III family protein [Candidatus Latescibacterota bacterium]
MHPPRIGADTDLWGDYHQAPVFFDMYYEIYCDSSNLELLHTGQIYIDPFGVRDVSNFSWMEAETGPGAISYSWWVRMESLRHMLPFIRSTNDQHREVIREWFGKWYLQHNNAQEPNKAAWERMTSAIRSMVLVFYLTQVEAMSEPDESLLAQLRETLIDHQEFLADPKNFDTKSNHAMWEAIGLYELTRVFPNSDYELLALERLQFIVDKSVSAMGVHREHAAGYHFHFLKWLHEYTYYLKSMPNLSWPGLIGIEDKLQAMLRAAYFMQDHDGNIPAIGDTDRSRAEEPFALSTTTDDDGVYFDKEAGFAIYKDDAASGRARYVVFNIQNCTPELPYHYHDDALAVYFSCGGEVILGDQGRYEYAKSIERSYFVSSSAHNTVVPMRFLNFGTDQMRSGVGVSMRLVREPDWADDGDAIAFSAKLPRVSSSRANQMTRRILIPKTLPYIEVEDNISGAYPIVILWNIGPDVKSIQQHARTTDEHGLRTEFSLITQNDKEYLMSVSVSGPKKEDLFFPIDVREGTNDPMLGWYSPGYQQKLPSKVIIVQLHPSLRQPVTAVMRITAVE